jgi:hypothetical protein
MGIGDLLRRNRLVVPPNQRSYAWEERHVQDLFQDMAAAIQRDEEDYFLGTIVLIQADKGPPQIADGQQRLATTSILLARIRDRLNGLGSTGRADAINNEYLRKTDLATEEMVAQLQLNVEDHDYFVRSILPSPSDKAVKRPAKRPSNERLAKASMLATNFIQNILEPLRQDRHTDQLVRWVNFIRENVSVVVVTVPDEVGAFRMFETLNDRGLRASQADILKNYFFSRASSRITEAQTLWNGMSGIVESLGDDGDDHLVTYIRHLWITTHGQTKERELADSIKKEITGETRTLEFLADANAAASDYAALWAPNHPKWNLYKNTTRQHLSTLSDHLKVEQIRPLLFAVARHFNPEEADKAFRLFVSWSVRFLVFGGRGGLLDKQYADRARDVGTKRITKARELREEMREVVPSDAEFEAAFATARVSRAYLARYYLRALDKTLKNDPMPEYVPNEDETVVNLEHVMPLTPDHNWQVDADMALTAQKLLGNMVLIKASKNTELGNASFDQKRPIFEQSSYLITNQVAAYKQWTIEEIRKRQAEMAKIAVKTWSLSFAD